MNNYFPIDKFKNFPTPFYYYDISLLNETLTTIKKSLFDGYFVHYAIKANANDFLLKIIAENGFGADIVSGGELERSLHTGFNPHDIFFAGVGKTDAEIIAALKAGIGCFNVESAEELHNIGSIAKELNIKASVAIRINPDIDAHTHHYITTGLSENKFGIDWSMIDSILEYCKQNKFIEFKGLHFHIGSQITNLEPYIILCERIKKMTAHIQASGTPVEIINVGGGLGVDYDNPDENPIPDFKSFFNLFHKNLPLEPHQTLHFELGRSIIAQCGSLIARVIYVKSGLKKRFAILDAGMNNLIRPALYGAKHKIEALIPDDKKLIYDVVGPICETSDSFATEISLPQLAKGDLIAIRSAGAYGEAMASHYNLRPESGTVFSCNL